MSAAVKPFPLDEKTYGQHAAGPNREKLTQTAETFCPVFAHHLLTTQTLI